MEALAIKTGTTPTQTGRHKEQGSRRGHMGTGQWPSHPHSRRCLLPVKAQVYSPTSVSISVKWEQSPPSRQLGPDSSGGPACVPPISLQEGSTTQLGGETAPSLQLSVPSHTPWVSTERKNAQPLWQMQDTDGAGGTPMSRALASSSQQGWARQPIFLPSPASLWLSQFLMHNKLLQPGSVYKEQKFTHCDSRNCNSNVKV
jgi:hypothetical protein